MRKRKSAQRGWRGSASGDAGCGRRRAGLRSPRTPLPGPVSAQPSGPARRGPSLEALFTFSFRTESEKLYIVERCLRLILQTIVYTRVTTLSTAACLHGAPDGPRAGTDQRILYATVARRAAQFTDTHAKHENTEKTAHTDTATALHTKTHKLASALHAVMAPQAHTDARSTHARQAQRESAREQESSAEPSLTIMRQAERLGRLLRFPLG